MEKLNRSLLKKMLNTKKSLEAKPLDGKYYYYYIYKN